MKLAEFVETSLVEITTGVRGANAKLKAAMNWTEDPFGLLYRGMTKDNRSFVEFDVAVTASSSESTSGGGGVNISVIRGGVDATAQQGQEQLTRIKFQVSIESSVS